MIDINRNFWQQYLKSYICVQIELQVFDCDTRNYLTVCK